MNFEEWKKDLLERCERALRLKRGVGIGSGGGLVEHGYVKATRVCPPWRDEIDDLADCGEFVEIGEDEQRKASKRAVFIGDGKPCLNSGSRCHGTDPEITKQDDAIVLWDDHDSNAGTAHFTGYCCLQCLLLDVWHELGNDGERIGDQIRKLKKIPAVR